MFIPRFVKVLCHLEEFNTHFFRASPKSSWLCWRWLAELAQGCCRRTQGARPAPGPKALLAAPVSCGPAPTQQQGTGPSVFAWVILNAFKMRCLNSLNVPVMVSLLLQVQFMEIRAYLYQNIRPLLTEIPVTRWNKGLVSFFALPSTASQREQL